MLGVAQLPMIAFCHLSSLQRPGIINQGALMRRELATTCKMARLGLDEVRSLDIFVALRDYTSHLPIVAPKKDKICVCVEDGKRIRTT